MPFDQILANKLMTLLAPPPPQQAVVGKLTLAMLNNSHWDTDPKLVKEGLPVVINRFYKLFKYYDSTAHMYVKAGESGNCKRVLTDLLLGITLLDLDYRVWVRSCGNPDYYSSHQLSSELLSIHEPYGTLKSSTRLVDEYTEIDESYCPLPYLSYILPTSDLDPVDDIDNKECPKIYPIRRYVPKSDIRLSDQCLDIEIPENPFYGTAYSYERMFKIQKFLSREELVEVVEAYAEPYGINLTEFNKIRDFEFDIARACRFSAFFRGD